MKSRSFQDLIVWQKARDLTVEVYKLTNSFPQSELYGLTNQMRRAAVSIAANIAESYHRRHRKEKKQFQSIAYGSGSELASHIEIAKVVFPKHDYTKAEGLLSETVKILNKFINTKF